MMANQYDCVVLRIAKVGADTLILNFRPSEPFEFVPGQFISLVIPSHRGKLITKRCYSLANSPQSVAKTGYELCVKVVPGGVGSTYLDHLNVGEHFRITAPYGGFTYQKSSSARHVIMISTGTGIAPFKSIVESKLFQENRPQSVLSLLGVRSERDIPYRGVFEGCGVEHVVAVSKPSESWAGFRGRVTDYLRQLPVQWKWNHCDFYLCGNGEMIEEVKRILIEERGVSPRAIYGEAFSVKKKSAA